MPYPPFTTTQQACSPRCAMTLVTQAKEKKARQELREGRQRLKTKSDWLKEAQVPTNAYIRERDRDEGCISCDKPASWGGQWHASHYRPVGNCSALRFHEMNIHKACSECNNFKSGNLVEFRIGLIKKVGIANVEYMESQNQAYSWEIDDAKEVKVYFKDKLKALMK